MIDIYMNGAEVHAETPEEEREASLILSAALSGKTIPAGGCICPDHSSSHMPWGQIFLPHHSGRAQNGSRFSVKPAHHR